MPYSSEFDVHSGDHTTRESPGESASVSGRSEPPPRIYTLPRMIRYARILGRLNRIEWQLLVRMSRLLGSLLIAQRKASMPALMARFDSEPAPPDEPRVPPGRLVYLVTGLVRFTLRDRFCMKRSILTFHFLRRWGYDARIRFGVVKDDRGLQGHAWVELNGRPLAERGDPRQRYAVTYEYPNSPMAPEAHASGL